MADEKREDKNVYSPNNDKVTVTMEMKGEFEEVMGKIRSKGDITPDMEIVSGDLAVVLDTVIQMEGGTKSAIAEQIEDTAIEYDSQAVVDALHILARYDLVVLEGNTWYPGPKANSPS